MRCWLLLVVIGQACGGEPTCKGTSCGTVSKEEAIAKAKKSTLSAMKYPKYSNRDKIALSARILHEQGQTNSLAGQISCREPDTADGQFRMTAQRYGIGFDEVKSSELLLVNKDVETIEGEGFPNYAIRFHAHVYLSRPEVRCIVHTHPPYINALGLVGGGLIADHMDQIALFEDTTHVDSWPGVPFGDEEGQFMVDHMKNRSAIILAHHGMLVVGKTMEEATYRAYFMEDAAKLQFIAQSVKKDLPRVDRDLAIQARDWRISPGPVAAHFHYWARQVLRNQEHMDALH